MRVHMTKQHSSEYVIICSNWDQSLFLDRASLKVHRRIHQGDKIHKCNICPFAFSMFNVKATVEEIPVNRTAWSTGRFAQKLRRKV